MLDGFEAHLGAVVGNSWENEVASVTANLNLWPRPLVVFMSVDRFEQLDEPVQQALISGGAAAFQAAADLTLDADRQPLEVLCDATAELVALSADDLAEIRTRLEPVYADLAQDPATGELVAAIDALKAELAVPPTRATCDGP